VTYAQIDGWAPGDAAPANHDRNVMDRWVLAELADLCDAVDGALERYDVSTAGRRLERFVDDLSNWYVRRGRRRFWRSAGDDPSDKAAAYETLHTCLVTLSRLLAPFTPFIADQLWEDLVRSQDPGASPSVHLTDYSVAELAWRDEDLRRAMTTVRQVVELGRQARNASGVKVRQPLARALVTVPQPEREGLRGLLDIVADELNIKEIALADGTGELAERQLRPNFRSLGPVFQSEAPLVAKRLQQLSPPEVDALVDALAEGEATLEVDGEPRAITPGMVEAVETPKTGWQLAREGGTSFALDVAIDDDLRTEGFARELIRTVNDRRKQLDLDLDARIDLHVSISPEEVDASLADAGWYEVLAREVLAERVVRGDVSDAAVELGDGVTAAIAVEPR
jgi:isoleucyl-tRNA synthetase